VALYLSTPRLREVDTRRVVGEALGREGCAVYLPRVDGRSSNMRMLRVTDLSECAPAPPFGIPEPGDADAAGRPRGDCLDAPLDVVLMPGLGFERNGHRLGRGGGYYDAFVEGALGAARGRGWARPLLVGLAFRAQVVPGIPVDAHDRRVDVLVTADGAVACTAYGRERWGGPAGAAGA